MYLAVDTKRRVVAATLAVMASAVCLARSGPSIGSFQYFAFAALLAWASCEDLRSRTIPDACVAALVAVRTAVLAFQIICGEIAMGACAYYVASGLVLGLLLVGFGLGFERVTGREGMGGGDVKLFAAVAYCLGIENASFVVALSCLLALSCNAGALVKAARGAGDEHASTDGGSSAMVFPFAPAIAVSTLAVAFLAML